MPLFVSANLGRHVDTAEFLRNVRALDDEAGRGTVIGFQEIDEADTPNEHAGLRKVLGDDFDFAGRDTRVPIAFGDKWSKVQEDVIKAAHGLARLSPARVITETLLEHDNGCTLAVLDLHFPRNDPRLLTRWVSVERKLEQRLDWWNHRGISAVWTADANRVHLAPMHPDEVTLVHHGLDWIRAVEHPDGAQLHVEDTGLINLTIDGHDAPWVRLSLTHPKEHR
jgi:hypothetical protein